MLIADNTNATVGRLYAVSKSGEQTTLATDLPGIAGVAVRSSGEIFVSTAPFGALGEVRQVDRATGASTPVLTGLGYGAGLAFDSNGHLIVQDADAMTFAGRLQRLPMAVDNGGLTFGDPEPLLTGMTSGAGVTVDSENEIFTTGVGGLYRLNGTPAAESPFDNNGSPSQFAAAVAFAPGLAPFEPFAGPAGGRLAFMADFGFGNEDSFVTLLTPAAPTDFNSDGDIDGDDLSVWQSHFAAAPALLEHGDANHDGEIDGSDFLAWQRQGGNPPESVAAVVPEPVASSMIFVAALILLGKTACGGRLKSVARQSLLRTQAPVALQRGC